jgi:DNA-binding GntR family transcriptional regulator
MKARGVELDINISILHALMRPGQRLSTRGIADIVGCSNACIYLEEKKALRKVHERLRRILGLSRGDFCQLNSTKIL